MRGTVLLRPSPPRGERVAPRGPKESASALGELEATPGFDAAVLLALDDAAVAGKEATLLQCRPELGLVVHQRLGNPVAHGTRLAGETSAGDGRHDVELAQPVGRLQWLLQQHLQHGTGE